MNTHDFYALGERVKAGDAEAQFLLGVRMMLGSGAPHRVQDGARLIDMSAAQAFTPALRLSGVLSAVGFARPLDWDAAIGLVSRAAALGDAEAQAELKVVNELLAATPASPRPLFERPRIAIVEGILTPAACDWIIRRASARLSAARVSDPVAGGQREANRRTNAGTGFALAETDLVLQAASARIAAACGLSLLQQEPTNILHYNPGEEFRAHFDALNPGVPHFARDLEVNGQRLLTFLIYLNADFDGGETEFPRLSWRHKGAKGDGMMFWNVDSAGQLEPLALHAGTAPTRGEKWLLSKWVRDKPLPLI